MAIALIIAFGTGTYAALMSTSAWRTRSNDASFAMLHEPALLVATTAHHGGATVDLLTEVLPPTASWTPTIVEGSAKGGLVLANKAASDLHVGVGDNVTLEHPQMTPFGLQTVTSQVPVAGIHPDPMRVFAYLDATIAARYGLTGVTNLLTVTPAPGTSTDAVRRALLGLPQVASAQAVGTTMRGLRDSLREYLGILRVATAITLLLALLIAFNSASIGMDERLRDHATMLAFGLPTTTVLAMAIAESAVIGVAASALGVVGGHYLLGWLTTMTITQVIPEIGVIPSISIATLNTALILGVLTVAVAPVFTARRLRHLDVPSTLRVIE